MRTILTCAMILFLLTACEVATQTQISEVLATSEVSTEAPATQEPVATEAPTAAELLTEPPTEIPTEPPLTCVTLLTPENGADIPSVGKVTFSWTPLDEAGSYILNIILPSGEMVLFETDQATHDRYMEAFVAGGEYQWQVIAQGPDGSEICVSEVATFDKPEYQKPKTGGGDAGGGVDGSSGGEGGPPDDHQD
jgi:hypothetical protein